MKIRSIYNVHVVLMLSFVHFFNTDLVVLVVKANDSFICTGNIESQSCSYLQQEMCFNTGGCTYNAFTGECRGAAIMPFSCSDMNNRNQCTNLKGCTWDLVEDNNNDDKLSFCTGEVEIKSCYGLQREICFDIDGCRYDYSSFYCVGDPTPCNQIEYDFQCDKQQGCVWDAGFDFDDELIADIFTANKTVEDVYVSIGFEDWESCKDGCSIALWVCLSISLISFLFVLYGVWINRIKVWTNKDILAGYWGSTAEIIFGILSFAKVVNYWDDSDVLTVGNKIWLICTGTATLLGGLIETGVYGRAARKSYDTWPRKFLSENLMGFDVYLVTVVQVTFGFYPGIAYLAMVTISWGWIFWLVYLFAACIVCQFVTYCKTEQTASDDIKMKMVVRARAMEQVFISIPLQIFEFIVERKINILGTSLMIRDILEYLAEVEEICGCTSSCSCGDEDK